MDRESFSLVLSGGGAKGAYQIGVWKALREEGIKPCACAGTSVGALNAGLFAAGNFHRAEDIWSKIRLADIACVPEEFLEKGNLKRDRKTGRRFMRYIIKNRGLVTRPLYRLIREYIDEKKIRNHIRDFGIATYSLSDMKPVHLFLDQIPEGYLCRYLLASAAMPIFRAVKIKGKTFTDGGVADNMPFEMMRQRGYRKIIIVDMSAIGINRKPVTPGTMTVHIKNSLPLDNELDFRTQSLERSMNLGYLDARRVFSHYHGEYFFLTGPEKLEEQICARLTGFFRDDKMKKLLERRTCAGSSELCRIRCFLPERLRLNRFPGISFLECAALSLNIDRATEYSAAELLKTVREQYQKLRLHREWKKPGFLLARKIWNSRKKNENMMTQPLDYQTMALALNREKEFLLPDTVNSLFPFAQAARLFLLAWFD